MKTIGQLFFGLAVLSGMAGGVADAGAAERPFHVVHSGFDERGRAQFEVPGHPKYYYLLLRGNRPDDCTLAVDMQMGTTRTVTLTDSVPVLRRACFVVKQVLLTTPLDSDGDGTSDVAELGALPQKNPFNAATRTINFADGAVYVPDRAAFDALSHRDNFPGAPDVREVKFIIMGVNTATPQLYFLNASRHVYHYNFARDVLGYSGSLTTFNNETYFSNTVRKNLAGSLVVHESWQPPGGGPPGVITMEFWPSDPVAYRFVQISYDLISRSMPGVPVRLCYHAASETQRTLYRTERAQFDSAQIDRLHVISTADLFGQSTYSLLNPGIGFGRLIVFDGTRALTARDVVIFRTLPNDITRTAGIITDIPQTPLSHINLKAKQNNTPNAYIKNASTDARLTPFIGRYVRFEPGPDTFAIREATQQEVDQYLESLRPPNPHFPVRDLTRRTILPLASLGFTFASSYGAKTANVAQLKRFLPATMVPNGYGVPFYYYDEFMKYSGMYVVAEAMMLDPQFRADPDYREEKLKALRESIKLSDVPAWMMTDIAALQANFPPGQPIRCRSSTNNEDLAGFSGAGLYDSYTHRPDEGHLIKSLKQVWASLWNVRAWDERDFYRVDHLTTAMGMLVTQNFDNELANGVGVTKNLIDPNWTGYYVNAQAGESLVTNPDPNAVPEEFLIAQLYGQSLYEVQYVTFSNLVPEGQTVITRAQAEQLANRMSAIQNHFRPLYNGSATFAMEIEWKIDASGQLIIKQARPWVD